MNVIRGPDPAPGSFAPPALAGRLTSSANGVIGLPGLHLSSIASSSTQGSLLTSSARDVHLDSGTQMVLRIFGSIR
ncbi:MAG: hypothetical protein LAN37_08490 [Acidobacteriia bacterium]|jgi:hypothetical protein|nr:hypothetical protein [Terriglobia bacterium]